MNPCNVGVKFDTEKPRMDLLDWSALEGLALGLTFGAKKYGSHNWRNGIDNSRLIASLLRHLSAIQRGEDTDSESGLPHIDLVGCNWLFLSHNFKHRPDLDDRWKPTGSPKLHYPTITEDSSTTAGVKEHFKHLEMVCEDWVKQRQLLEHVNDK